MKPKGKVKKKEARFGVPSLASLEAPTKKSDLSQLRKPVDTNLSSLKQVVQLLDKGSDEVKAILTYECDIIYECRVCRSLFRSLVNFISHKRAYCLQQYCVVKCRRDVEPSESAGTHDFSNVRAEVEDSVGEARRESVASSTGERHIPEECTMSIDPEYTKNCTNDRILRSQSAKVELKKDLTTIVDMLTKRLKNDADCEVGPKRKQNKPPFCISSDSEQILLEIIEPERAAYQTVLGVENCTTEQTDLMKSQALELKNLLNRNTGVLGPDGQLIEVDELPGNDDRSLAGEEFEANPSTSGNTTCTLCDAKFATKKTLTFHVKSKHVAHRICYTCPCCTGTFTNRWSAYRHLFKVHRKTNDQVRRLRTQIQARAFRRDLSRLERAPRASESATKEDGTIEESKNLMIAREWVENLELDAELQRCGGCGKRFERRAALVSHLQICQKRLTLSAAREARRKRARKILPRRVSGIVADTETTSAGRIDNETKATTTISEEPSSLSEEERGGNSCKIPMRAPSSLSGEERGGNSCKIHARAPSSSPKSRSSLSGRKFERCSVDSESKSPPTNESSEVSLVVERKSEVFSTERESEAPLNTGTSELSLADQRKSDAASVDRNSVVSVPERLVEVCLIDTNSKLSLTDRKYESSSAKCKSQASSVHRESDVSPPGGKSEFPVIDGRTKASSSIRGCDALMTDLSSEISIRVEDVSSLSKDVWDKIGSGSADSATVRTQPSGGPITQPTNATASVLPDIPEVIYTSIDNSRPVALSVLATEKKLGIQYRGIRLPTVTLEKINVSRAILTDKKQSLIDKPSISLNSTSSVDEPVGTEIVPDRLALPIQKLQCPRCNRRFSSEANLQRHITVHLRRNRYRCKLCKDFRSLLKCDIVAHCNKVHNAKNDRSILADLVIDVPVNVDEELASQTSQTVETRIEPVNDLEVIDVAASLSNAPQETTMAGIAVASQDIANDAVTTTIDQTAALPKPKRGRPPKSKTKRRRKLSAPKTKHSRHVSPPRLPEDTSLNEINDIIVNSTDDRVEPSNKTNDDSPVRATSRSGDPELQKMIMEVIFGSSQKENAQNSRNDTHDQRSSALDTNDYEKVLDHRDKSMITTPLTNETKLIDTGDPHANIIAQAANNNGVLGYCRNYELSTIAVSSETVFFTENQEVPSV